jgi:tRNA C32,U32 (ribose-2'-O)-methylase TrmJ
LRKTNIYATLEEALTDRNVVCGTGMPFDMHRKRRHSPDDMTYVEPRLFFDGLILSKNKEQKIDDQMIRMALVFGGERRGELLPSSSVLFSS